MRYSNEQHLREVDPLCDLVYCAASNLANIVPPTVKDGVNPQPTLEHAAAVFDMGVQRLGELGSELGITQWPDAVGQPVESYYDRRERGDTSATWFMALNGAVLPAAMIAEADLPTPQGTRLLKMVEAAVVTDRVAGAAATQAKIISVVRPDNGIEFGPRHDLYQAYLERTMYHYPAAAWDSAKNFVRGVTGTASVARYVFSETSVEDDTRADIRTFGY